ncbi:MAG TPA: hypothetical protein VIM12_12805 [Noviherbaspirillum sp.]|jgi:chromosome segregation ATPase|uniref:hypothetical protein n=1 Tax=Noviherbaspirillum sp. TaxID=1926288 RepID=UPI002F931C6C
MSNLQTAKRAIEAELDHARQGLTYYQSRVEALEAAIGQLEDVEGAIASQPRSARPGRQKHASTKTTGAKAAKGPGRPQKRAEADLPATGMEFWPTVIGSDPMAASEVLAAAVKSLGITPTREQEKRLAQRQANALSILTRKGVVSSSGSGRSRRYFR